jgi:hypothetical protein
MVMQTFLEVTLYVHCPSSSYSSSSTSLKGQRREGLKSFDQWQKKSQADGTAFKTKVSKKTKKNKKNKATARELRQTQ